MKICHIITGLSIGGAETTLYNLLNSGLGSENEVTVISLSDTGDFGDRLRVLGIKVYALGMKRRIPPTFTLFRLRKLMIRLQPDLIQGWMYHGNFAAAFAAWLAPSNPGLIWNIRQCLYSLGAEKLLTQQVVKATRHFSTHADAIIYNSRLARQQHEAFGFAATRSQVIANGFKLENLQPRIEQRATTRFSLGMSAGCLVVGHVARYHPMKDHATFLRASIQVAEELPQVYFLLAGRKVNFANSDLAGIVPPHLVSRFYFVGEHDNVPALMAAMDVFCQSSWSEAFPNVLGEAMAAGVPCVATDVGDSAIIIGETGIVVPPKNSNALARALLAILSKSDQERLALGRAGRSRIETNYSLPDSVAQYEALYKNIFNARDIL